VGANVRTIILAVPPLLPLIQRDLGLSHTGIGLLTALPVLIMGIGAWPAGLIMHRAGGRFSVALGLLVVGAGSLLRGVWPSALPLFTVTVVLSLGIALAQTSVVALVRLWFPHRIGYSTALYTNGIIFGETLGAGLTVPLLARLGPDAWRFTVAAWGMPVLAVLFLWLLAAPEGKPPRASASPDFLGTRRPSEPVRIAGRPLWLMAAHLGLLSGCCSLIYFNMNAWIAPFNAALGQSPVTPLSLTLLNASQLPVCLCLTPFAHRLTGRRAPFAVSGGFCLVAIMGWALSPATLQPLWAVVFGGSTVAVLVLGLALPPFFATPATVARLVGATLSVSYLLSFSGQVIGGRLWDLTGRPIFAFLPVFAASVALIVLAALLPRRRNSVPERPHGGMMVSSALGVADR